MPSLLGPNRKRLAESYVLADKLREAGMALLCGVGLVRWQPPKQTSRGFDSLPLHLFDTYFVKEFYIMATKKPNKAKETTSASVASKASKLLSNPKTPANVKSVAASALTQKVKTKTR